MRKKLWLLIITLAALSACEKHPSENQLNQWYQQAVIENQRLTSRYAETNKQQQWQLTIEGENDNEIYHLDFAELNRLATTHVLTQEPHPGRPTTVFDFRGVRVSDLLDMPKIKPDLEEITFVCDDAYRVAVKTADIRKYDIILAIERDGAEIPRSEGGPLYLVYPQSQFPEMKEKYPSTNWGFYVTHLLLGSEPLKLKVAKKIFNQAEFEKIPQTILRTSVGYRLFWPDDKIKLQGAKLQDVLKAAGFALKPTTEIVLKGKANVNHDPGKPLRLTAAQLQACEVILAARWGDNLAKIPPKMGGPLTLVFDASCEKKWGKTPYWLTFVEEIEVYQ